jgi:hypothetical protein
MAIQPMLMLDTDNMISIANMDNTGSITNMVNMGNTINTVSTISTASMITHNIMPHSQVLLMAMPLLLHRSQRHLLKHHLLRLTHHHRTIRTIMLFHRHHSFSIMMTAMEKQR